MLFRALSDIFALYKLFQCFESLSRSYFPKETSSFLKSTIFKRLLSSVAVMASEWVLPANERSPAPEQYDWGSTL